MFCKIKFKSLYGAQVGERRCARVDNARALKRLQEHEAIMRFVKCLQVTRHGCREMPNQICFEMVLRMCSVS